MSIVKTEESLKEKNFITEENPKTEIEPPKSKTETLEVKFNKTGENSHEDIETPKLELNQSEINPRAKIKIPEVNFDRKEEKPNAIIDKSKSTKVIKIDARNGISKGCKYNGAVKLYQNPVMFEYPTIFEKNDPRIIL